MELGLTLESRAGKGIRGRQAETGENALEND